MSGSSVESEYSEIITSNIVSLVRKKQRKGGKRAHRVEYCKANRTDITYTCIRSPGGVVSATTHCVCVFSIGIGATKFTAFWILVKVKFPIVYKMI